MKSIFYTWVGHSKRPKCEVHMSDISKYGFRLTPFPPPPPPFCQKPKLCTFCFEYFPNLAERVVGGRGFKPSWSKTILFYFIFLTLPLISLLQSPEPVFFYWLKCKKNHYIGGGTQTSFNIRLKLYYQFLSLFWWHRLDQVISSSKRLNCEMHQLI